jgi:hypothetical protein
MSAMITSVCNVKHQVLDWCGAVPLITFNEGGWAYCAGGGASDHVWTVIEPITVEELRLRTLLRHEREPIHHLPARSR